MSDNGKVLDLRSLQNAIAGKIEIKEGRHDVLRFNAEQYQIALNLQTDPMLAIERTVALVVEIVPTLTVEQVRKQDPLVLQAIITLASQGIAAVEKLFPNAASPETSTFPG